MTLSLELLDQRLQTLEHALWEEGQTIHELDFSINSSTVELAASLVVDSRGNQRRWRQSDDLRGALKYSNWSVSVAIKDSAGRPVKCDWIRITKCNYRIMQSGVAVDTDQLSFTTGTGRGWDNCSFQLALKAGEVTGSADISLG